MILLAVIGLHLIHGDVMCLAPTYAAEYAVLSRQIASEDLAVDQVGRRAGRQVCGVYFGRADLVDEHEEMHGEFVYDVVGWRFADHRKGDGRIVWQAFVVGPARVAGGMGR